MGLIDPPKLQDEEENRGFNQRVQSFNETVGLYCDSITDSDEEHFNIDMSRLFQSVMQANGIGLIGLDMNMPEIIDLSQANFMISFSVKASDIINEEEIKPEPSN